MDFCNLDSDVQCFHFRKVLSDKLDALRHIQCVCAMFIFSC
jgi:hypothetical protein